MDDRWSIAGTIGTWVAVGVALIALIGIVGPVLIWLGARTEKHKILRSIGSGTNGYLSQGFHLGPNIYLAHRIRAPLLKNFRTTRPFRPAITWDVAALKSFDTPATWAHFGALLSSCGVTFPKGVLLLQDSSAYLPIHPSWVLAVGVLGRYSRRPTGALTQGRGLSMFRLSTFKSLKSLYVWIRFRIIAKRF